MLMNCANSRKNSAGASRRDKSLRTGFGFCDRHGLRSRETATILPRFDFEADAVPARFSGNAGRGKKGKMKADIHPKYVEATITCACGNVIHTRSTKAEMHVNTCGACHPFYTGSTKMIDTEGRVDRFKKKYAKVAATAAAKK